MSSRAMFLAFFGEYRGDRASARIPAVDVGAARRSGPAFAVRRLPSIPDFLEPVFPAAEEADNPSLMYHRESRRASSASRSPGLIYVARPGLADPGRRRFRASYNLVYNKYFVDEVYDATIVEPAGRRLDVRTLARRGRRADRRHRQRRRRALARHRRHSPPLQSGNIRSYAAWVVLGSVARDRGDGPLREGSGEPPRHRRLPPAARLSGRSLFLPKDLRHDPHVPRWSVSLLDFRAVAGPASPASTVARRVTFVTDVPWIALSADPLPRRHRWSEPVAGHPLHVPDADRVLISWRSIDRRVKEFYAFLLLLEFGLVGVFAALGSVPLLRVLGTRWCRCIS